MSYRKQVMLAVLVGVLLTAASALGQAKWESEKQDRATVLLRFAKDRTVSANCSQTLGMITQSMLQVEGVKNAKIDAKNNGVQVSYDPGKTGPQKIVAEFNRDNPDTPLGLLNAKQDK